MSCTEVTFRIPHIGSEFDAPEDRAEKAVPGFEICQLTALLTLTKNGCKSSSRLVNWKREKQNELGLVPGGYGLLSNRGSCLESLSGARTFGTIHEKDAIKFGRLPG